MNANSKKILVLFSAFFLVIMACNKDKFETRPSLTVKSVAGDIVPVGSPLEVNFEFTDKEGDIDSLYFVRKRLNQRGQVTLNRIPYYIPEFTAETKGEIKLLIPYSFGLTLNLPAISKGGNPPTFEPDTLTLRFYLKDKAKNTSDTVEITPIIVIR